MMPLEFFTDLIIVLCLLLYGYDGYRRGFLLLLTELAGTVLALYLAFRFASVVGDGLSYLVSIPESLNQLVGFFSVWISAELAYFGLISYGYQFLPESIRQSVVNKVMGLIPSLAKGLVVVSILLTLVVALPIDTPVRSAITTSRIGKPIVEQSQGYQQQLLQRYESQITKTLTFLTTNPVLSKHVSDSESLELHFSTDKGQVDATSESAMLALVNQERQKVGLKALGSDPKLQAVARAHAKDMLARGYFAHNTPEGIDPFQRMDKASIVYLTAGENLAFAPTVNLAHIGLMNSPKHKENILYPAFGKAGIGVIDAGIYGKMFVQEFSN